MLDPKNFDNIELKEQTTLCKTILTQDNIDSFREMMDDELLPVNENSQAAVQVPDCLNQKFAISKKEVTVQDKYVIGADLLRFVKGTIS